MHTLPLYKTGSKAAMGKTESVFYLSRILVSLLFIIAAVSNVVMPGARSTIPGMPYLETVFAGLELMLAAWLVSSALPSLAAFSACLVLTVFGAYAGTLTLRGAPSCGCFGSFVVPPMITWSVDVSLAILLVLITPIRGTLAMQPIRLALTAGIVGLATIPPWYLFEPGRSGVLLADGSVRGGVERISIDARGWVGKPFPLMDYINVHGELAVGGWLVAVVDPNCAKCRALVECLQTREGCANVSSYRRVAFLPDRIAVIEVVRPTQLTIESGNNRIVAGTLDAAIDWVTAFPVIVRLRDGIVSEVIE